MSRGKIPSRAELKKQLVRIQDSATFADSERLMALLRFVVEEVLAGRSSTLKESVIGNAVYDRNPPYDPRIDSTVRVEARRLRQKLNDYYSGEGAADPVRIELPTGGYVPDFAVTKGRSVERAGSVKTDAAASGEIFETGQGAAVAIMPFRALSHNASDQSFADGLTDEIAFALGRAKGLRITSRGAAHQLRDSGLSPAQIAAELKVDAILVGTVRRIDGVVRVTLETSDVNGFVVWSDRFDVPDRDQLELQEAIAATVLSRVRFDSSLMRAMKIRPGPQALAWHAKIYRARQLLDCQTPASISGALEFFSEVAAAAPDYARGHSGVADCYCDLFRLGLLDEETAAGFARPAAQRALDIDPQSVEALTARATITLWLDWDGNAAEPRFVDALRFGEYARAARLYGVLLTMRERYEEAERQFRIARRIEPFSASQDIAEAISHYQSRRYHLLAEPDTTKWQTSPAPLEAAVYRSLAHVFSGNPDAARPLIAYIRREAAPYPDLILAAAEIEAWLGEPEQGRQSLQNGTLKATHFARAALAAAVGDDAALLSATEASIEARELSRAWFRTDPRFDRVRALPEFAALVSRVRPSGAA